MFKKLATFLAGAALVLVTTTAMAVPISGTIDFTGSVSLMDGDGIESSTNPVDVYTATGIHFIQDSNASITTGLGLSGAFLPIGPGAVAAFNDFYFSPGLSPSPVALWSVVDVNGVTYEFRMTSVNVAPVGFFGNDYLLMSGSGVLSITGAGTQYDETIGSWTFSTQDNGALSLTFSGASAVPEPGTMVLLGAGMLGLAIFGKRRMNREA